MIDLVLKGKSVFFTGAAGTGKSFLLKKLHQVRCALLLVLLSLLL